MTDESHFNTLSDEDNELETTEDDDQAMGGPEETNSSLDDLANTLRTGAVNQISEAIRHCQYLVESTPDGHAKLPGRLNDLGLSFWRRFECTGDMDDILAAIRHQRHAIQLTPNGHADLPCWLNNLGNSFSTRFESTGKMDDILEAIKHQRLAVQLTPAGHTDLPDRLNNLGVSLSSCFVSTEEMDDISQAIQYQQQAVQLTPNGHVELPSRLTNLGNSFWRRFERTGDMNDILEAIRHQKQAVQLAQNDLPHHLNNLGNSYSSRFERAGDIDDISEAIRLQQQAVLLTPDGHVDLPRWLNNLGLSFWRRFERTGDMDDISEAIQHQQHAVQLTTDKHADLPCWLNNLGLSFCSRFEHSEDIDDISEAIRHQRRAVRLTPDKHADLPTWLDNLGNSLSSRFDHTEDMDDISEAIQHQRHAVKLAPDGHSAELPRRLNNLGVSLSKRFECNGNVDDISEAIQHIQLALQLTPDGHVDLPLWLLNFGNVFLCRFESSGMDRFLQSAISNYRLSATSLAGPPSLRLTAAKQWATTSSQSPLSPPSDLLDAHSCIIHLLSLISGFENTIQRRHENLVDASQLTLAAAAAALSLDHPDKALEWLVEGRCIVWNQMNQLRTPVAELHLYDSVLAERLSILSTDLENAGLRSDSHGMRTELPMKDKISLENEARAHMKHAKDWEQLLDTIRNIPQFKDFLQPRRCADIMSCLPDEGPIIIVNIHSDRCDALALIAGADKPVHIPLPKFSFQEAERLFNGFGNHLLLSGVQSRLGRPLDDDDSLHPDIIVDFPTVLGVLWSEVVDPILEGLAFSIPGAGAKLPRIWWCPTGPLAFLPIHAAGIYYQGKGIPGKCLSDFAVSSYIPTGRRDPTALLMISQPKTPGKREIPFARVEVEKIESQLRTRRIPYSTLADESATVSRVLESMEKSSCIHLACHASQDAGDPLQSSVHLHNGPLKLSEIMKMNLQSADFAFLSACQTSKGDAHLPEEVVHLASGMLAAGYRSVVGTMWSVFDEHGPDLAEFFYKRMLEDATNEGDPSFDGRRAARALHDAIKHLQEKVSGSLDSFLAWVPYIHIGI